MFRRSARQRQFDSFTSTYSEISNRPTGPPESTPPSPSDSDSSSPTSSEPRTLSTPDVSANVNEARNSPAGIGAVANLDDFISALLSNVPTTIQRCCLKQPKSLTAASLITTLQVLFPVVLGLPRPSPTRTRLASYRGLETVFLRVLRHKSLDSLPTTSLTSLMTRNQGSLQDYGLQLAGSQLCPSNKNKDHALDLHAYCITYYHMTQCNKQ